MLSMLPVALSAPIHFTIICTRDVECLWAMSLERYTFKRQFHKRLEIMVISPNYFHVRAFENISMIALPPLFQTVVKYFTAKLFNFNFATILIIFLTTSLAEMENQVRKALASAMRSQTWEENLLRCWHFHYGAKQNNWIERFERPWAIQQNVLKIHYGKKERKTFLCGPGKRLKQK